jgi:hypothetical protein
MNGTTRFASAGMFFAVVAVLACWLSAFPVVAKAQGQDSQGQNAVCTSTTGCSTTVGTNAFIDASMWATNVALASRNFCTVLNYVLANVDQPPNYPFGAVIDARGLPGTTSTSMTCTASPWAGITGPPANILLPAGTIVIPTTWTLPPQTHLFGQGDNPSSGTVIRACTSTTCTHSFSGTAMIQFCSASGCPGVSVEKLILDGQGLQSSGGYISGIFNQYSQASYVDHVSLYQILGTGLSISGSASNSGPYTNISFDTGGHSGVPSTVCLSVNGLSNTRGIRGLSCTSRRVAQTMGFV